MSEIVEQAARAVEDEIAMIYGRRCSTENARRLVLRVFDAIRIPTPAMIDAAVLTHVRENGGIEHAPSLSWKAMIDAAQK